MSRVPVLRYFAHHRLLTAGGQLPHHFMSMHSRLVTILPDFLIHKSGKVGYAVRPVFFDSQVGSTCSAPEYKASNSFEIWTLHR